LCATAHERTAYQQHHTIGQSWVVDALVVIVCGEDEVWSLRNDELRQFTVDGKTTERLSDQTDYAALAAGTFGVLNLPIDATRAALAAR